jgi:probable DNA repair protein
VLTGAVPPRRLLNSAQAETVWRGIIAESPQAASILDLRGTAESAVRAWELVQQYRLPLDGRFGAHEDWAAFRGWAGEYSRVCEKRGWIDEARLPDAVIGAIRPQEILLAGFDEFTPQQQALLDAMTSWELLTVREPYGRTVQRVCADAIEELQAAAEWASDLRRREPSALIGVVLLGAGHTRAQIERAFQGIGGFHISMGEPLAIFPLVSAALLILRLEGSDRWPAADASRLLRSPYVEGGITRASERALFDAQLRRNRRVYVSREACGASFRSCGVSFSSLGASAPLGRQTRKPSEWSTEFGQILANFGWPGDRSLSSHEYQVHQSWQDLLRTFASLDNAAGALTYDSAVVRLDELAGATDFQPQDPGAAIQIVGPLEAAGARFDHLWIVGADDSTWPAPAHPHPFLPLSVQRERNLPHSSPAREWEFAVRTFARLRASALDIVVSWPQRAGDVELRPSPLLERIPHEDRPWRVPLSQPLCFETEQLVDETAPALETANPRGGTQVIRLQSSCPFRAFADIRLGARPMEAAELGLTAADKGKAVHKALELFWDEVRDHATLIALTPGELSQAALRAANTAVRGVSREMSGEFERRFREMEIGRVARLVCEWAAIEIKRSPFQVAASERERVIEIGGLQLNARMDRVDLLPNECHVILDYKTNAPSPNAWTGDRPDEPQVPLYAISNDAQVAAVAFAQVGAGEKRFKGSAVADGILPGVKKAEDFSEQIDAWRRVLEPLARGFKDGRAEADPKRNATCTECRMTTLCRIHETVVSEDADE